MYHTYKGKTTRRAKRFWRKRKKVKALVADFFRRQERQNQRVKKLTDEFEKRFGPNWNKPNVSGKDKPPVGEQGG
jgi:hypothetical protein